MRGVTRWEYRAVDLGAEMIARYPGPGGGEHLARKLNELGAGGWEVYSGPLGGWFFLKRPHQEQPPAVVAASAARRAAGYASGGGAPNVVEPGGELDWHYGPTEADPDPGKMWCFSCGGEVWAFDGGYICRVCGHQDPAGAAP